MKIQINNENVVKSGNNIIKYNEEFKNYIDRFVSIVDSINIAWEGDDSLKYINAMKEKCLFGLKELNDCMEDYGIYLKKVPDAYKALDEVFSSKNIDV